MQCIILKLWWRISRGSQNGIAMIGYNSFYTKTCIDILYGLRKIWYNSENKNTMQPLDHLHIPNFKEFVVVPHNKTCPVIDSTRLMVEILWWLHPASGEFWDSTFSSKMLLDGKYALVVRYKREKDGKYRPACTIWFDADEDGVHIRQIQWSNDKNVAFRFHSSFNTTAFLLKLIEESFIKKGIPVHTDIFPKWLENASYSSKASERYMIFRSGIEWLKKKYAKNCEE